MCIVESICLPGGIRAASFCVRAPSRNTQVVFKFGGGRGNSEKPQPKDDSSNWDPIGSLLGNCLSQGALGKPCVPDILGEKSVQDPLGKLLVPSPLGETFVPGPLGKPVPSTHWETIGPMRLGTIICPRAPLGSHSPMGSHGSQWEPMVPIWIPMRTPWGPQWVIPWVPVGSHGYPWELLDHMGPNGGPH